MTLASARGWYPRFLGTWSFAVGDDVTVRTPGGDRITEDPAAPVPAVVTTLT